MSQPDGGPAFPSQLTGAIGNVSGMTIRDYFAAAILQGILAGNETLGLLNDEGKKVSLDKTTMSRMAYAFSEAMLMLREARP